MVTDPDPAPTDLVLAAACVMVVVVVVDAGGVTDLMGMAAAVVAAGWDLAGKGVDVGDISAEAAVAVAVAAEEGDRRYRAYIPMVSTRLFVAADRAVVEDIFVGGCRSGWRKMRC